MARAKKRRKKKNTKAARFFFLAALTLLIAGFIARREIPILMRPSHRPAPARVGADHASLPDTVFDEDLRAPAGAASPDRSARELAAHLKQDLRVRAPHGPPHEVITGTERQQLGDLIKERSR